MNEVKHTPGEWSYSWENDSCEWAIVTDASGSIVANVNTESGPDAVSFPATRQMPAEANARLIAAAPEMLEALKLAEVLYKIGLFDAPVEMIDRVVELRRAAIAKAEGRL